MLRIASTILLISLERNYLGQSPSTQPLSAHSESAWPTAFKSFISRSKGPAQILLPLMQHFFEGGSVVVVVVVLLTHLHSGGGVSECPGRKAQAARANTEQEPVVVVVLLGGHGSEIGSHEHPLPHLSFAIPWHSSFLVIRPSPQQ